MKRKIAILIKAAVSFAILFALLYRVGINSLYATFLSFNLWYVPLIIFMLALNFIVGSYKINLLFGAFREKMNYLHLISAYVKSWSIAFVLPGKLDYLPLMYLIRKTVKLATSAPVMAVDTAITYVVVFSIAAVGWVNFFSVESGLQVLGYVLIAVLIVFFLLSEKGRRLLKKYVLRKYAATFKGFTKKVKFLLKCRKDLLAFNFILTFAKVNINAVAVLLALLALDVSVPFFTVLIIFVITLMVSGIPISLGGLGVRESVGVFLYSAVGVSPEKSAVALLSLLLIYYIVAGVWFWAAEYLTIKAKSI